MSRARLRARGRRRKTSGRRAPTSAATDPAPVPRARSAAALRREPPPVRRPLPQHGTSKLVGRRRPARRYGALLSHLYDADAAWRLVHEIADLSPAAAVVVKHANPCGRRWRPACSMPTKVPSSATLCPPLEGSSLFRHRWTNNWRRRWWPTPSRRGHRPGVQRRGAQAVRHQT